MAELRSFIRRFRSSMTEKMSEYDAGLAQHYRDIGIPPERATYRVKHPVRQHAHWLTALRNIPDPATGKDIEVGWHKPIRGAIIRRDAGAEYPFLPRLTDSSPGSITSSNAMVFPSSGNHVHEDEASNAAELWLDSIVGVAMSDENWQLHGMTIDPRSEEDPEYPTDCAVANSLEMATQADLDKVPWMKFPFWDVVFDLVVDGGPRDGITTQLTGKVAEIVSRIQSRFVWIIVGPQGPDELSYESCVVLLSRLVSAREWEDPAEAAKRVAQVPELSEVEVRQALEAFLTPPHVRMS